jgi:hypothetical protein
MYSFSYSCKKGFILSLIHLKERFILLYLSKEGIYSFYAFIKDGFVKLL